VAREPNGPRGSSPLTVAERDSYPNLILLCLEHHKIVDDDPGHWTVERLHEMKAAHEAAVESAMSGNERDALEHDLMYSRFIAEWVERVAADRWEQWTSGLLAPTPSIEESSLDMLDQVRRWLFTRPWPQSRPELEDAFENFRRVANTVAMVAHCGLERRREGDTELRLIPLYKRQWVENYDELAAKFDWTVALIHDLTLELTRAANYLLDRIRLEVDPLFRIEEGVLTVERIGAGLYTDRYRPRYSAGEVESGRLFSGLSEFLDERTGRDIHFGEGRHEGGIADVTPVLVGPNVTHLHDDSSDEATELVGPEPDDSAELS
jgi:hypothetical protein